jgi:hypothetical protein
MFANGTCGVANDTASNCCTQDSDCVNVEDLCWESVCVNITANEWGVLEGRCTEPTATDCTAFDPNVTNLCHESRCEPTTGECVNVTLVGNDCTGACCIPNVTTSTTECVLYDHDWCVFGEGGYWQYGVNCSEAVCTTPEPTPEPTREPSAEPTREPTADPSAEPTREPTAEPTREPSPSPTREPTAEPSAEPTAEPTPGPTPSPTPEPTVECASPTQCPSDPFDKCNVAFCNESSVCTFAPKNCTAYRVAQGILGNPCYADACDFKTGQCSAPPIPGCCYNGTDGLDLCHNPGAYCKHKACFEPFAGSCLVDCSNVDSRDFCAQAASSLECAAIATAFQPTVGGV